MSEIPLGAATGRRIAGTVAVETRPYPGRGELVDQAEDFRWFVNAEGGCTYEFRIQPADGDTHWVVETLRVCLPPHLIKRIESAKSFEFSAYVHYEEAPWVADSVVRV